MALRNPGMPWTVWAFTFGPHMTETTFTFENTVPPKYSISPAFWPGTRPIFAAYSGVYMKWMAPSLLWKVWAQAAPDSREATNAAVAPAVAARNEMFMRKPPLFRDGPVARPFATNNATVGRLPQDCGGGGKAE